MAVCGDNLLKLILQSKRAEDEDNLAIYYSLIALANQLIKNALVWDILIIEKDILYFKIEAAGLINQFPYLVICGICDYLNTYKNKEW